MNLIADFHIHTYYSDGKESVEAMALACINKGLETMALTDHGTGHLKNGTKDLDSYYRDIDKAREKYEGKIKILHGIEFNLMDMDGTTDIPDNAREKYDIILCGFHKTAITKKGALQFYINRPLAFGSKRMIGKTTMGYVKAMDRYPMDIIVHPGYAASVDMDMLSLAAAKHNVAIEINGHRNFMSKEQMIIARENGAIFTINSDAHSSIRIGDTKRAEEDAENAGIGQELVVNTPNGPKLNCFK